MKIHWAIFNVLWIIVNVFITISQSYFATIMFDQNGSFTFDLLLRDYKFWVIFAIWVVGNVIFLSIKIKSDKEAKRDDIVVVKLFCNTCG